MQLIDEQQKINKNIKNLIEADEGVFGFLYRVDYSDFNRDRYHFVLRFCQ